MLLDQEPQSLRNMGNLPEEAADEIARLRGEVERLLAKNEMLKDAVRSARADEAHCWGRRVDTLSAQLHDSDARYMALLKAVADGVAMQPRTVVLDLGPNAEVTGLGRNRSNDD
jgi:hypothetical protein